MEASRLQFITHFTEKYSYTDSAMMALEGGCRWIQLRMKDAEEEEIEKTALQLLPECRKRGAVFIIDDHVELVQRTGADGVHLGKNDMPADEARKILGEDFIIGGTANTFEDICRLAGQGVDCQYFRRYLPSGRTGRGLYRMRTFQVHDHEKESRSGTRA